MYIFHLLLFFIFDTVFDTLTLHYFTSYFYKKILQENPIRGFKTTRGFKTENLPEASKQKDAQKWNFKTERCTKVELHTRGFKTGNPTRGFKPEASKQQWFSQKRVIDFIFLHPMDVLKSNKCQVTSVFPKKG